jgi:glutathionylspermidine synthase
MQRHSCPARPDWRERVEAVGLTYHSHEDGPYWDESAAYELTRDEVGTLETAANVLHRLCLEAAESVIAHGWWSRLRLPEAAIPAILASWERDDFSLYGRFDLAFDGSGPPKLLEYNADTPTALIEASVAQWFWLQDVRPEADQFNSLHERLIEAWRRWSGTTIHFGSIKEQVEDEQTVLYLRDTAEQAGVATRPVYVEDIGWDARGGRFVDLSERPIERCFKLYPWEWLWQEEFGVHLGSPDLRLIEPAWKMLLANKGLLPVLWELFPDHPNLLPAYEDPAPLGSRYLRKSRWGREGRNVAWIEDGTVVEEVAVDVDEGGSIYQAPTSLARFDGQHAVFGVWIVDHEAAGLGIREDTRRITGDLSRFVPHFFLP